MDFLICLPISLAGAFLTQKISSFRNIGSIRSSAGLTISLYCLIRIIDLNTIANEQLILNLFFGATFIGMSRTFKFNKTILFFSSIIYSLIVLYLIERFKGYGGTLGLSAFLSVLLAYLTQSCLKIITKNIFKAS